MHGMCSRRSDEPQGLDPPLFSLALGSTEAARIQSRSLVKAWFALLLGETASPRPRLFSSTMLPQGLLSLSEGDDDGRLGFMAEDGTAVVATDGVAAVAKGGAPALPLGSSAHGIGKVGGKGPGRCKGSAVGNAPFGGEGLGAARMPENAGCLEASRRHGCSAADVAGVGRPGAGIAGVGRPGAAGIAGVGRTGAAVADHG